MAWFFSLSYKFFFIDNFLLILQAIQTTDKDVPQLWRLDALAMFNVKKMRYAVYHKEENPVSKHVLLWTVDPVEFVPPEIMWPSVNVLQDCLPEIPMEKVVNKSTVWRMTIVPMTSTAIACLTLAWMSAKQAFVATKLYAQLKIIVIGVLVLPVTNPIPLQKSNVRD